MLDRRLFVAGLAGFATFRPGPGRAAPLAELTLHGPPAGPSVVLAYAVESGALRALAGKVSFKVWRTPDEMRAGLTSGRMGAVVVPTYAAANMYNRGLPIRLVNVMTDGLLYVTASDPAIDRIEALKGRRLALPFKNDMPDLVLRRVLATRGLSLDRDVTAEYTASPTEAIQMLLTGRADAALTPEPSATAAIVRAMQAGKSVHRAIDLQQAWSAATGGASRIPQAGLAVSQEFASSVDLAALAAGLEEATRFVVSNPASAARAASAYLDLPPPVIERSIPHSNFTAARASAKKDELKAFFGALAAEEPKVIGGKVPDDGFFAL